MNPPLRQRLPVDRDGELAAAKYSIERGERELVRMVATSVQRRDAGASTPLAATAGVRHRGQAPPERRGDGAPILLHGGDVCARRN